MQAAYISLLSECNAAQYAAWYAFSLFFKVLCDETYARSVPHAHMPLTFFLTFSEHYLNIPKPQNRSICKNTHTPYALSFILPHHLCRTQPSLHTPSALHAPHTTPKKALFPHIIHALRACPALQHATNAPADALCGTPTPFPLPLPVTPCNSLHYENKTPPTHVLHARNISNGQSRSSNALCPPHPYPKAIRVHTICGEAFGGMCIVAFVKYMCAVS